MPTIAEILAAKRKAAPAAPLPSYADVLAYSQQMGPTQSLAPAPAPSPTPQPYATPDPYGLAQHMADRQQAVAQLSSPVTPALEVPQLPKSLVDHIMEWFKKKEDK